MYFSNMILEDAKILFLCKYWDKRGASCLRDADAFLGGLRAKGGHQAPTGYLDSKPQASLQAPNELSRHARVEEGTTRARDSPGE